MRTTLGPVVALLVSVSILLTGQGLQTTLLPMRASLENFPTLAIGTMGAVYFLFKPINSPVLRAKVKIFLELYASRRLLDDVLTTLKITPFGRAKALDRRTPSSHGNISGTQAWASHPGSHHEIWPRQRRHQ